MASRIYFRKLTLTPIDAPYVAYSNTSTYQMSYNDTQRNAIILNAYNMATQGNSSLDSQWPTCVGCAILSRSLDRTNTPVPDVCTQCFTKYCWNGTTDSSTPAPYIPTLKLADSEVKITSGASLRYSSSVGLAVGAALWAGFVLL